MRYLCKHNAEKTVHNKQMLLNAHWQKLIQLVKCSHKAQNPRKPQVLVVEIDEANKNSWLQLITIVYIK